MKKTAISIALLVAMGLPVQNYAQTQTNTPVTNNQTQVSLVKILKKLEKSSKTKFFYSGENDRQIEFQLNNQNKIIKVWLIDSGLKHELK